MSHVFDTRVPKSLADIQCWFGAVISQKMGDHLIASDVRDYIVEDERLGALDRMQLYHQSYWLRLLEALHEEFPLVTRLFGKPDFNEVLGIPYLYTYPANHWSLNLLGNRFVKWLEESYGAEDKKLVTICAKLDWSCQRSFFAKSYPSLDLSQFQGRKAEELFSLPLTLQSHVALFELPANFIPYRETFLAHPVEYWESNDFPALIKERTYHFILFRGPKLLVQWDELSPIEYKFLSFINEGKSIEEVCELFQEEDLQSIEEQLAFWVQKWLIHGWITRAELNKFPGSMSSSLSI